MIVMPSNNYTFECGRLFGLYPERMAHLQGPDCGKQPSLNVRWALDNGVFGAFTAGKEWSEEPFYSYLDRYATWKPMWAVVPDSVGNRDKTLAMWNDHWHAVAALGIPLAFAAQDGMTPADVPKNADVVFIGGSTAWKWRTLLEWTKAFPRVHVGRVNSRRLLEQAEEAGAESCDGTGWFRDPTRTQELEAYLKAEKNQPKLIEA